MADVEFRRVEDLSLEQLRDEVWLWRTDAAARLAVHVVEDRRPTKAERRREMHGVAETLYGALTSKYHDTCFACGFSIHPGDAVISDVT